MTEGHWGKRVKRSLRWRIESNIWRVQEPAAPEAEVRRVRSGTRGMHPPRDVQVNTLRPRRFWCD